MTEARRGTPGRKTELGVKDVRNTQLSLDELTIRLLKVLGGGNVSRGVREAARYTYEAYQRERFTPPKTK